MTDRLAYFTSSFLWEKEREKKKKLKFALLNSLHRMKFLSQFFLLFFFFFFEIYSTPDDTKNIAPE